jgi:hypothetical protein
VTNALPTSYTAFDGHRRIASGPLHGVALSVKQAVEGGAAGPVLIFDDSTGRSIDIDMRDVQAEASRIAGPDHSALALAEANAGSPRGRGRPKLGVVPREVTLLPRHWEWLATQPGGASVALRKLVEEARRAHGEKDRRRLAHERAYHFMSAMAGDMPGFEEATRALFANDESRMNTLIAAWPDDVRDHAIALAFGDDRDDSDASSSTLSTS